MKTNRRGFFGVLAGLVGGVVMAFQKGESEDALELKEDVLYEPTHIQVTGMGSSTDNNYFEFTIWGVTNEGKKLPLKYVKISEDGKDAEWDLI